MKKELSSLSKRELTNKEQSAIKGRLYFLYVRMCDIHHQVANSTGSSDSARDGGSWY